MTGIFLLATAVTRGWNGYRNKSQHRKSTLEKKILPPFQQGFEPATFQSRVWRSNHWAIPVGLESTTSLSWVTFLNHRATPPPHITIMVDWSLNISYLCTVLPRQLAAWSGIGTSFFNSFVSHLSGPGGHTRRLHLHFMTQTVGCPPGPLAAQLPFIKKVVGGGGGWA